MTLIGRLGESSTLVAVAGTLYPENNAPARTVPPASISERRAMGRIVDRPAWSCQFLSGGTEAINNESDSTAPS